MSRLLVVLVLAVAGLSGAACGKDAPAQEEPSAVTRPAGEVLETAGRVTATRRGATRELAATSDVYADDVIETEADASVVIELAHNGARWAVEGGMKARVDASLAWGLSKQDPVARVDHATSAAGRHAEKTAAETKESAATATAPEKEVVEEVRPAVGDKNVPTVPTVPSPPKPREANRDLEAATTESELRRQEERAKLEAAKDAAACDEVACTLDPSRACCAKRKVAKNQKTGGGNPQTPAPGALPEALSAQDIRTTMAKVRVEAACGDGSVKGVVKLAIVVAADGHVTQVEVKETPDPGLGACVARVVKALQFPKSQRGITFTYPFRL